MAAALYVRRAPPLAGRDSIVLADFVNTTGDAVFDGTLKQALAVQLDQSPYLNVFSEERVQRALRLMGRTPETPVTAPIAREICEREGINAMLRGKLGESLASSQKLAAPIEAITSSLDALKAFSLAEAQRNKGAEAAPALLPIGLRKPKQWRNRRLPVRSTRPRTTFSFSALLLLRAIRPPWSGRCSGPRTSRASTPCWALRCSGNMQQARKLREQAVETARRAGLLAASAMSEVTAVR